MAPHRDDLTDEEMAAEIGVPVALVTWARLKDSTVPPPPLDLDYDVGVQEGIVQNQKRLYSGYGLADGTYPE